MPHRVRAGARGSAARRAPRLPEAEPLSDDPAILGQVAGEVDDAPKAVRQSERARGVTHSCTRPILSAAAFTAVEIAETADGRWAA